MSTTEAGAGTFEHATAVAPLGEGRFRAEVDPGWSTPIAANGGYLAAILVRAIEAHGATAPRTAPPARGSDPRQLRSLTCHYLRPVQRRPTRRRASRSCAPAAASRPCA